MKNIVMSFLYCLCTIAPSQSFAQSYVASDLLAELHDDTAPSFALPLGTLPPPPPSLAKALQEGQVRSFFTKALREQLSLSSAILDMSSEVSSRGVWRFRDDKVNQFFENIFKMIVTGSRNHGLNFDISTEDLFHGHLFATANDFGIIFHAKEYPTDIYTRRENPGSFDTASKEYPYRNFIWLLSANQVWMLRAEEDTPLFTRLIYPSWLDPKDHDFADIVAQYQHVKTLQEEYFIELGESLGSVNYFKRTEWYRLDPNAAATDGLLFFTIHGP